MTTHQITLTQVSQDMAKCIQDCLDCHSSCLNTVSYCLQKGGHHAEPSHLKILMDCAQICQTAADFMLRGSELHREVCDVCADVNERCADDCERHSDGGKDAQMQSCAEVCRRCLQSCRQMASVA